MAAIVLVVPVKLRSQVSYDWTVSTSADQWGTSGDTDGTYTRSATLTTGGAETAWSALLVGTEAPYDGAAGLINLDQQKARQGVYTRTDPDAGFDLSAVGSSATIRTVYNMMDKYPDNGGIVNIFEFGLTTNADHFGAAGDDSVFVAGQLDSGYVQDSPGTYDLHLYREDTIDQTPTDLSWNSTPVATLATDLNVDAIGNAGYLTDTHTSGVSVLLELIWTNLGEGMMEVEYRVVELEVTGPKPTDMVTAWSVGAVGTWEFSHELDDLTSLRPGFGVRLNDSDVTVSGTSFDWHKSFEAFAIPEPSAAVLGGVACLLLGMRRRRRPAGGGVRA